MADKTTTASFDLQSQA